MNPRNCNTSSQTFASFFLQSFLISLLGLCLPGCNETNGGSKFNLFPLMLQASSSPGSAQWARSVTDGTGCSYFNGVAAGSDGSVYAAGYILGTGTFAFESNVTATGSYNGENVVLVKYDGSGAAKWAQTATGGNNSCFNGVAVGSDGSVYAAGYIDGGVTCNFGNNVTAFGPSSGDNIVLVKYNSSGAAQWAKTVTGGGSNSWFKGVAVGTDGSVYVAGYIYGTSTYAFGDEVTATGLYSGDNILIVKYNSSGAAQWAKTVTGGGNNSWFNGVSVGSDGSVYAAGYIASTGSYNFGNYVTATGSYTGDNILLVKYNSSGVAQWAQSVKAGNNNSCFIGVTLGSDGSVYAAGYINGGVTYNFGNSVTVYGSYGGTNIVLVKYNSSGAAQWARSMTAGSGITAYNGVAAGSDGSVIAAGYMGGGVNYNFGNNVKAYVSYGGDNIVLVKYNSSGAAQWAQSVKAGSSNSAYAGLAVGPDGSVYAAGYIDDTIVYNFGNTATAGGIGIGSNVVLVKYK
jgi:outer membrane protein assembly factor BamB